MGEREQQMNRRISLLTSVGIHFIMLVLFLFVIGWKAPDPPLSAYGSGVELNFGLDDAGGGDVQPLTSPGPQDKPAETNTQTPKEEVKPVETPREEPEKKQEESKPETKNNENTLTSKDDESPVEVKETKKKDVKEVKEVRTETQKKDVKTKPVEKAEKKEVKAAETPAKKTGDETKRGGAQSQGDDKGKTGDKGSPEGSLDPNGQYTGKPGSGGPGAGGGNGFGLDMSGWNWDEQPKAPAIPDNDNGKLVFEITVDADGEITGIKTIEKTLSSEAERLCKAEIQKRSLVRTSTAPASPVSKGRITFILKTR